MAAASMWRPSLRSMRSSQEAGLSPLVVRSLRERGEETVSWQTPERRAMAESRGEGRLRRQPEGQIRPRKEEKGKRGPRLVCSAARTSFSLEPSS